MTPAEAHLIETVLAWRRALRVKTTVPTVTNLAVMRAAEAVERERERDPLQVWNEDTPR